MTKQEQFLWMVQTIILANAANLASIEAEATRSRHIISASGVSYTAYEALVASTKIPGDMSVEDAANDFCGYMLENLRAPHAECPSWFARS